MAHWHPSLNCSCSSCSSCIFKSPSVQNVAMNVVSTCEIVQNRINGVYKWGMVWFSVGLAWGWTVHPHDPIILRLARLRKAQRSTPRPFPQDSELSRAEMEKMDRICAFVVCILCVYIYTYIYIHIHIYTYTYIYIYIHIHIYIYIYIYWLWLCIVYIYTYIHDVHEYIKAPEILLWDTMGSKHDLDSGWFL